MGALSLDAFRTLANDGAVPLDLRPPHQFAEGHLPGSLCLQFGRHDLGERAALALPRERRYVLVMDPPALGPIAERLLTQAGFRVEGHLAGGVAAWSGETSLGRLATTDAAGARREMEEGGARMLDVREGFEFQWGHVEGAQNIPHGEVWGQLGELDPTARWLVLCNDQVRSGLAASLLLREGFQDVTLVLGGIGAWTEAGYPLVQPAQQASGRSR
ncbi:rhodanese-like domain-containing protein [Limnochorda pilosa]|uniref:Rhodanese domain-containing protein n=1 Tax=Limnochorda pilosa TaxID=1555112 RepID=A0A0K2SQZ2_LIMPI|nr:rhodanese-like domain-containing protein [Limnochorda pilosa]BAS29224.1 hypothetical protein LIP_3412 [Limnochorda pilosa]